MRNDKTQAPWERVYRADSRFGEGPITALRHLIGELIDYRSHIVTIFLNDFQATYRGTFFGVFWNFMRALLPVSIYVLLATFRVLPSFEGIPNSVAIVFNVMIWFLLAGCVQQPLWVVRGRNKEVMKTALPLSVSIASSFLPVFFDVLVRLGLLVILIFITGAWPSPVAPLLIPVLVISLTLFLGFGLLVSIINIVARDAERVVAVALQYGIFVSGAIFPLSKFGSLVFLELINPFAVFIIATRSLTFHGTIVNALPFAVWSFAGVLLFLYAARLFYLMEYRIRGVQ